MGKEVDEAMDMQAVLDISREGMEIIYPELTSRLVLVTSELAEAWLNSNLHNRKMRIEGAMAYARDMESGNWPVTGDTIKIDKYGVVLDGQHRLQAVIASQTPLKTFVVFGLEPEVQRFVDAGMLRTFKDVLTLSQVPYASTVSAVLRRIALWEMGSTLYWSGGGRRVTHAELVEAFKRNPDVVECARVAERYAPPLRLRRSTVAFAYWLFSRSDQDEAVEFLKRVAEGAGLGANDPRWVLRERIARELDSDVKAVQVRVLRLMIMAWNHYREGQTITRLQLPSEWMTTPSTKIVVK